jgi:eukaryotic-like serine/threonine-protein kinase
VIGDRVGQTLAGRYRLTRRIGSGGAGSVYEAEHLRSGQKLAVKILRPEWASARDLVSRFQREAKTTALLSHPSVVETFDFGALDDGALFLAMELVRGVPLSHRIDQGALEPTDALAITRQILDALSHTHAVGVVHRDLKPDNVLLVDGGVTVKLIDFGIAKLLGEAAFDVGGGRLTATGIVFGTPAYMAPEQALGRILDGRADLYALGCILFEMLTGRPPFDGTDAATLMQLHCSAPVPRLLDRHPDLAGAPQLDALLRRALAKTPDGRFTSATDMIACVDELSSWFYLMRL